MFLGSQSQYPLQNTNTLSNTHTHFLSNTHTHTLSPTRQHTLSLLHTHTLSLSHTTAAVIPEKVFKCVHDDAQHTATHCNTLQHTATHCNTLQHTVTHCNERGTSIRRIFIRHDAFIHDMGWLRLLGSLKT